MINVLHVMLTGGVGSRLWPLSRQSKPKQYLQLFDEKSLFELAVERNKEFSSGLIIVGNKGNKHLSEESLKKLDMEYMDIVEATPRNTAPAVAFAAFAAQPDDILLITPADHIIKEGDAYGEAINSAVKLASKGNIVTFGVKPTRPEIGYGYIEHKGEEVLSFREKPNVRTAKDFIAKGTFLWNSGMFCFKAKVFLEELQQYAPEVHEKSLRAWETSDGGKLQLKQSLEIPSISIDYAVMEKSSKIKVVPANFEWNDMGSFEAVYDYLQEQGHPVDQNGNMVIGTDKFTAFVGLENCIFVNTEDALLVLSKNASQDVKQVYSQLEKENSSLIE